MKLIYISNTRLPSEKANSYQSMVMCESFAKYFDEVEFWYPKRRNKKFNKNPFDFYKIKKIFKLKKIFSFDSEFLHDKNQKIWFILQNLSFVLNYVIKLRKENKNNIVFTRDSLGLRILSLTKKYGIVKQKVFFEAHIYSKKISKLSKNIDGLVVINNYLKDLYDKDKVKNIIVAHDGVKIEDYENIEKKETKENNIVYVGNLFKWKGVYTLVDSMKYLNRCKLTIVGGSKKEYEELQKYIKNKKLKNIELVGFVEKKETIKYIKKADVLVLPNSGKDKMSYYTSPLKLFEYMASKRIIVASRLPSIEEILEDKKNAILFEADNPKDLADKIEWCLENDTSQIIRQAYKDVQEYTWEKRAEKIYRWIKESLF